MPHLPNPPRPQKTQKTPKNGIKNQNENLNCTYPTYIVLSQNFTAIKNTALIVQILSAWRSSIIHEYAYFIVLNILVD